MPRRPRTAKSVQPLSHECSRCGRIHNGASPPPGWGHEPGQGLICDDCEEQLHISRTTGIPVFRADRGMNAPSPDWGPGDQRLADLNRRVGRWALRAELAILGTAAAFGALGLPIMVKNILLGIVAAYWGTTS